MKPLIWSVLLEMIHVDIPLHAELGLIYIFSISFR
jgi:hypothetical protein